MIALWIVIGILILIILYLINLTLVTKWIVKKQATQIEEISNRLRETAEHVGMMISFSTIVEKNRKKES